MRALTTQQSTLLAMPNRSTWVVVEIDRTGSGAWVDMTSLVGSNWVDSVQWSDNVDDPSAAATVTLKRAQQYYSLSPLVDNVLNTGGVLCYPFRKIRISVGNAPDGQKPAATDYAVVFRGRISKVRWGDDKLELSCRDHICDLVDTWIEQIMTYSSTSGTLAELIMQQILSDNAVHLPQAFSLYSANGTTGTPFNAGDSPAWYVKQWSQQLMPIYTALNVIAQQIGWLLKMKYNTSAADFVLTWFDPLRGNTTPVWTFTGANYFTLQDVSLDIAEIRNVIRVVYYTQTDVPAFIDVNDGTSVSTFGRRFMQIANEASSNIDSSVEATKMADGALSDLAQPTMSHSAEMPLFWPVEICDMYLFKANGAHYSTDQTLGVISYQHTLDKGSARTTLQMRGKASGGVNSWYERQLTQTTTDFGSTNLLNPGLAVGATNNLVQNGDFSQFSRG